MTIRILVLLLMLACDRQASYHDLTSSGPPGSNLEVSEDEIGKSGRLSRRIGKDGYDHPFEAMLVRRHKEPVGKEEIYFKRRMFKAEARGFHGLHRTNYHRQRKIFQ